MSFELIHKLIQSVKMEILLLQSDTQIVVFDLKLEFLRIFQLALRHVVLLELTIMNLLECLEIMLIFHLLLLELHIQFIYLIQ